MKQSDLQKHRRANRHVACSGNRLCPDCEFARKANKQRNSKGMRNINKKIVREEDRYE